MKEENVELKNCPFCGKKPRLYGKTVVHPVGKCPLVMFGHIFTIKKWNNRHKESV